jgi:hypothetical protein
MFDRRKSRLVTAEGNSRASQRRPARHLALMSALCVAAAGFLIALSASQAQAQTPVRVTCWADGFQGD